MKEFHFEWMDRKPKATKERSLVETNLTMGKSIRLLTLPREMNPGLLRKLESVPKSTEGIFLQRELFFKGMEWSG